MPEAVEISEFRALLNVDDADLLSASNALQREFLDRVPGFLRRTLVKREDGLWIDLVVWNSRKEALQAAELALRTPVALQFFRLMDPSSVTMHHAELKQRAP